MLHIFHVCEAPRYSEPIVRKTFRSIAENVFLYIIYTMYYMYVRDYQ